MYIIMINIALLDGFYIPGHTRRHNQPHCNPLLITLRSPIDIIPADSPSPALDITLEQSSRESVADAAVVEPISMIYIFGWLGPG